MEKGRMESAKISEIKLYPYLDYFPEIHPSAFLASGVKIIGNVKIGENSVFGITQSFVEMFIILK